MESIPQLSLSLNAAAAAAAAAAYCPCPCQLTLTLMTGSTRERKTNPYGAVPCSHFHFHPIGTTQ